MLFILPGAICCSETLNVYVVLLMCFAYKLMATTNNRYILTGTFSLFINLLPEAIYSLSFTNMLCLWCVGDIAMLIHCIYIPTFMVTSANII